MCRSKHVATCIRAVCHCFRTISEVPVSPSLQWPHFVPIDQDRRTPCLSPYPALSDDDQPEKSCPRAAGGHALAVDIGAVEAVVFEDGLAASVCAGVGGGVRGAAAGAGGRRGSVADEAAADRAVAAADARVFGRHLECSGLAPDDVEICARGELLGSDGQEKNVRQGKIKLGASKTGHRRLDVQKTQ